MGTIHFWDSSREIVNCAKKLILCFFSFQLTIEHDPDALKPPHLKGASKNDRQCSPPHTTPVSPSSPTKEKERLFKRRDEGYISGSRSRQLRRTAHNKAGRNTSPGCKERSSSMSRLLDGWVVFLFSQRLFRFLAFVCDWHLPWSCVSSAIVKIYCDVECGRLILN